MTETPARTFLMIGRPGTGKTTFLAALWSCLSDESNGGLTIEALPKDRQYLGQCAKAWLSGKTQGHTPARTFQQVEFSLKDSLTGGLADIVLPDMSGEVFD